MKYLSLFSGKIYYDKKGYALAWINGKDVKCHVHVWEHFNGKKPKGYDIHHKDFNKGNFDLDNLELVSGSDHRRIHAGWVRQDGEWIAKPCNGCEKILDLDNFYKRKGRTPTALCKICHCKSTNKKSL